jgi:type IV pilus assembly protein PilO
MTYVDDEFMPGESQEEAPNYPSAFGITFTPTIGGVLIAVFGLGVAIYLGSTQLAPVWENKQKLQSEVTDLDNQVKKLEVIKKQLVLANQDLEQAKQQNKQVLNLFADEKTLDTLLLDLNSFIKSANGTLNSFEPKSAAAGGGTSGAAIETLANGKLKRKSYNITFDSDFDQTQSILRQFERLQTLLVVKDFKAELWDQQGVLINLENGKSVPAIFKKEENNKVVPGGKPTIRTTFKLDAIVPVTDKPANQAAPAAKPAKPK